MDILSMECPVPEPAAAVIQEERASRETESSAKAVKEKWTDRLAEKIKKAVSWKSKKEEDIFDGFYTENKNGEDTCPMLDGLSEALDVETENKKMFVLIPIGDTETPVIRIEKFPFLLGRAEGEADACLGSPKISRVHARLEEDKKEVKVVDMNSANGTYRNDESLTPGLAYTLNTGDILKLADLEFICQWC